MARVCAAGGDWHCRGGCGCSVDRAQDGAGSQRRAASGRRGDWHVDRPDVLHGTYCALACKAANDMPNPETPPQGLSSAALTYVIRQDDEGCHVKAECMHRPHPACASACTARALRKTAEGRFVHDAGKCIGCRYCHMLSGTACPPTTGQPRAWVHSTSASSASSSVWPRRDAGLCWRVSQWRAALRTYDRSPKRTPTLPTSPPFTKTTSTATLRLVAPRCSPPLRRALRAVELPTTGQRRFSRPQKR